MDLGDTLCGRLKYTPCNNMPGCRTCRARTSAAGAAFASQGGDRGVRRTKAERFVSFPGGESNATLCTLSPCASSNSRSESSVTSGTFFPGMFITCMVASRMTSSNATLTQQQMSSRAIHYSTMIGAHPHFENASRLATLCSGTPTHLDERGGKHLSRNLSE